MRPQCWILNVRFSTGSTSRLKITPCQRERTTARALEFECSGWSMCTHISANVPSEAWKVIMRFIKGLESTCASNGTLFNQTELLITSRQGFHWARRWPAPMWAHYRLCAHCVRCRKFIVLYSDLLNMSRTGACSSIILLKAEQWAFGDRWKIRTFVFFLLKPPPLAWPIRWACRENTFMMARCARGHRQMKGLVPCWWQQRSQDSAVVSTCLIRL